MYMTLSPIAGRSTWIRDPLVAGPSPGSPSKGGHIF